jgi:hypothetical protein
MNQPSKKSKEIADLFHKYLQSRNKALIETFSLDDIQLALIEYHGKIGRTFPFYDAMEQRVSELKKDGKPAQKQTQISKEKWKDRVITATITFTITIIGVLLVLYVKGLNN